jgi:la-related protein 1
MEEENGFPDKAYNILKVALISCSKLNEHLLPRMIKLRERQYRNDRTREWLSMLKYESLEKSWKSILEGSLFEARVGNFHATRDMLKFLRRHVPWYGPLFLEAYRLEEREENDDEALKIIQQGLVELPRYGPLWFGMIHIKERRDILEERCQWQRGMLPLLNQSSADCAAAVVYISRELMWRVYLEKFLIEERALEIAARGMYNHHPYVNLGHSSQRQIRSLIQCRREIGQPQCQRSLCHSLLLCASNLRWKVLLIGVRFELRLGNEGTARKLLAQAYEEIPKKSLSSVIIECSRLEEYLGHINRARKILRRACQEMSGDWRLFYEWILLEARQGSSCLSRALEIARTAALRHPSTGRIWALLAQLYHRWEAFRPYHPLSKLAPDEAYTMFSPSCSASFTCNVTIQDLQRLFSPREMIVRNAIAEVPKSGEVWCEEGRARMNPLHKHFDLTLAQQSLTFAMQFTPQFGDTLIEYLRLELLIRSCLKVVCRILDIDFDHFVKTFLVFDMESDLFLSLSASSAPTGSGSISTSASAMTDDSLEPTVIFRKIHQATGSGVSSSVSNSANSGSVKDKRRDIERIFQLQYLIEEDIRRLEVISFPQLHRRCLNADPNYGMLWAHCRDLPDDISIRILARAKRILLQELLMSYPLYLRATLQYVQRVLTEEIDAYQIAIVSGVNSTLHRQYHHALHTFIGNESEATRIQWVLDEIRLVQRNHYRSSRSTDPDNSDGEDQEDILNGDHDEEHTAKLKPLVYRVALTGHSFLLSDFSTGCIEINRSIFNPFREEEQTWQFLFGTDSIV